MFTLYIYACCGCLIIFSLFENMFLSILWTRITYLLCFTVYLDKLRDCYLNVSCFFRSTYCSKQSWRVDCVDYRRVCILRRVFTKWVEGLIVNWLDGIGFIVYDIIILNASCPKTMTTWNIIKKMSSKQVYLLIQDMFLGWSVILFLLGVIVPLVFW